jgi:transcriptional regulator with XRE-family HTH domain
MSRQQTDYELLEKASPESRRLLRQEELILAITEVLSETMVSKDITKTELARRLGKSKGFVSQILSGGRNLTLRTIADVADALDCRVNFRAPHQSIVGELRSAWQTSHSGTIPLEIEPAWQFRAVRLLSRQRTTIKEMQGAA